MPKGGKREGAGRKPGSIKPDSRNKKVMIRFNDEQYAQIVAKAEEAGKRLSTYLHNLIMENTK